MTTLRTHARPDAAFLIVISALCFLFLSTNGAGAARSVEIIHPSDPLAGDFFGNTVFIDGDVLVVGAPFHQDLGLYSGAAYVFRRDKDSGVWQQEAKLIASDGAQYDQFGEYVGVSGDWIVVSARRPVSGDGNSPGAAYVFRYDSGNWTESQKLIGEVDQDRFGSAVAIDGDVLVVTAINAHDLAGVAYVYRRTGGIWGLEQMLEDSKPEEGNTFFGESVAVSGSTVMVGASKDRTGGKKWAGAVYVYVYSPPFWQQQQVLTASDTVQARRFGVATAVDGDRICVGAPFDGDTLNLRGTAYLFERSGTNWSQETKIVPESSNQVDYVGRAVAINRGSLVIGAPTWHDNVNGPEPGSAYIYEWGPAGWTLVDRVFAPDSHLDDFFGNSVAVSDDWIAVGAIGNDANGIDAGAAYVLSSLGTTDVPSSLSGSDGKLVDHYPNPFSGSTTIVLELPRRSLVDLSIYDLQGRHVRTLIHEELPPGRSLVRWDGRDGSGRRVSQGVYFSRLSSGRLEIAKPVVVLR
jgi:hypothetical protein